jgi:hypothetical protein
MTLNADQARELACVFRQISVALGDFRFQHWAGLSKEDRDTLENAEWTLLNYSSDFITQAVGLVLDDTQASLARLQQATAAAQQTVATIQDIKKVITLAALAIKLAAALASTDPGAIAGALGNLASAVE